MPPKLFGFREKAIPEILAAQVKSGDIYNRISQQEHYPGPNVQYAKVWWATAKEEISAATPGSVESFQCTSGQVYLLKLDRSTGKFVYETKSDGTTKVERKMWNVYDSKIKVSDKIVFQCNEDRYGNVWLTQPVIYKPWCRFTLNADLSHSDTYKAATIEEQWGYGFDHPSTSINVYNMKTHTAGYYVYEGDSGDYGYAQYDPQNDKWWINPTECP